MLQTSNLPCVEPVSITRAVVQTDHISSQLIHQCSPITARTSLAASSVFYLMQQSHLSIFDMPHVQNGRDQAILSRGDDTVSHNVRT